MTSYLSSDQNMTMITTEGISLLGALDGLILAEFGLCSPGELRGGKGVPERRSRRSTATPHYFIYEPAVYLEETPLVYGNAEVDFISAKSKPLQVFQQPPASAIIKQDAAAKYSYIGEVELGVSGSAISEFFDFGNFLKRHDDEELILDILTATENPFTITTFETNPRIRRLRREDDEILSLLNII